MKKDWAGLFWIVSGLIVLWETLGSKFGPWFIVAQFISNCKQFLNFYKFTVT